MDGQFVILEHVGHGRRHFDFMLSAGEVLETWQFYESPLNLHPDDVLTGQQIRDHRIEYLEYEGPVSNNRGHVHRVDGGPCQRLDPSPSGQAVRLAGRHCNGWYTLRDDGEGVWTLQKADPDA